MEVHQEISQASQGKGAKGASQTHYARNKGPGFFSKPKEQQSLLKPIKPDDMLKRMQAKNKWDEAEVHWLSSSQPASTQAAISHEDSHTSNWLDNTIYSLAHAGVEAHIGLEYALGISPYSLDQLALRGQPLPDLINFGIGATVGYGMQAALILEAGPIRIAEGLYQGSAELISKVSEVWGKNAAENIVKTTLEKYPKQLEQYSKLDSQQLEKAINSHAKQIAKHESYVENPVEHVPNWEKLSKQHQKNLIYHWEQDIARHNAYSNIAQQIIKQRLEELPKNGL